MKGLEDLMESGSESMGSGKSSSKKKIMDLISQLDEMAAAEGCGSALDLVEKYSPGGDEAEDMAEGESEDGESKPGKVALIVARMKAKKDAYEG